MIKRDAEIYLNLWFKKNKRRKPLLIRGARQVGKTTLIRNFTKEQKIQLVEINLEKPWKFTSLVNELNPRKIIEAIEFDFNIDIEPSNSIIFFDEVQASPSYLKLLRYFFEECPEYAIIMTGSLLDFVLAEPEFSLPVGRIELLYLNPLSFEEFLNAAKESKALNFIKGYSLGDKIPEIIHGKLNELLRIYIIVGGMPEVVNAHVEKRSRRELEKIKSNILETYKLDFNKYRKNINIELLNIIFDSVPRLLGKKVKYTNIDSHYKSNDISKSFNQLCLARLITKIFNTGCNGVPLGAEKKINFFKPSFLDTGLLMTMTKIDMIEFDQIEDINYVNNGTIAEQFISQQLLALEEDFRESEIYYWSREKKASSSEVDFVITDDKNSIIPIEVKSGSTGSLRSLQMMVFEKSLKKAIRFNSDYPTIFEEKRLTVKGDVQYTLISLPHYLVGQIYRLLQFP